MKRREFIKKGALFLPAAGFGIFVPRLLKAGPPFAASPRSAYRGQIHPAPAAGGGGGSCPADGSPDVDQATEDNAQQFGLDTDRFYIGQKFTDSTTRQICKVRFYLGAVGTISAKFYTCRIYTLSGNNLSTVVATSNSIAGNNGWANTAVVFTFAGNPTVTGGTTYAYVVYSSDASGNPAAADATNRAQMNFKETTNPHQGEFNVWNTTLGLDLAFSGTSDAKWSLYWFD